jgi:hypothetical protein
MPAQSEQASRMKKQPSNREKRWNSKDHLIQINKQTQKNRESWELQKSQKNQPPQISAMR